MKKEIFVIYIVYFRSKILIYLACKASIALLLAEKISVPKKYIDFLDVFFKKLMIVFFDYLNINKHVIDLKPNKQPLYKPIYSLSLVKLKTLKTYIKVNLANKVI